MNDIIGKNPGFFYFRYLLLFLYGIYSLNMQSNNPEVLVKTLGFIWLISGVFTLIITLIRIRYKKAYLVYMIFLVVDFIIALFVLFNSHLITKYIPQFIGIISIIIAFSLILYRSEKKSNKLLYIFQILILIFGISMFLPVEVSDIFLSYLISFSFVIFGFAGLLLTTISHFKFLRRKNLDTTSSKG